MLQLSQDEFDRLRDRALAELRHPRHTARLLLRDALDLPARDQPPCVEPKTAEAEGRKPRGG
jgi:hypothetical protein